MFIISDDQALRKRKRIQSGYKTFKNLVTIIHTHAWFDGPDENDDCSRLGRLCCGPGP